MNTPCSSGYFTPAPHPLFIVLSGPSGAGKDAVLSRMRETHYPIKQITTVTTRKKRPGEREGIDYCFITAEKYRELLDSNELLESANVYGNYYGVPKGPVREALASGHDAIVRIDVQGAATIKRIMPGAVFIFLAPKCREDLVCRLGERKTESPEELALRLQKAEEELRQLPMFDYVVLNPKGEIERAVADIQQIIRAEQCRVAPRRTVI